MATTADVPLSLSLARALMLILTHWGWRRTGNVLSASYAVGDKPVSFVRPEDQALYKALKGEAFEVQVTTGDGAQLLFGLRTCPAAGSNRLVD